MSFSEPPPALAPVCVGGIVAGMKATFIALLAVCLPLTGADKKKPGTPIWEFKTGNAVNFSPAIGSDGTVYVGSVTKSSMPSIPRVGSSYGDGVNF